MRAHFPLYIVMVGAVLGASLVLAAREGSAQDATSAGSPSFLLGRWSLNRELSGSTPTPDVPDRRGGRRGGGFGFGGGGSGGGRSGGQAGQGGGDEARAESERLVQLVQELLTPTAKWRIASDVGGALAFTNADGRTMRYTPNNKPEKHQLTNGTIETRSRWNRGEFRQEIVASSALEVVRTFTFDASTQQLVVTTTFDGGGRGGQLPPFRVVYDREED